jgi:hypothetical protein
MAHPASIFPRSRLPPRASAPRGPRIAAGTDPSRRRRDPRPASPTRGPARGGTIALRRAPPPPRTPPECQGPRAKARAPVARAPSPRAKAPRAKARAQDLPPRGLRFAFGRPVRRGFGTLPEAPWCARSHLSSALLRLPLRSRSPPRGGAPRVARPRPRRRARSRPSRIRSPGRGRGREGHGQRAAARLHSRSETSATASTRAREGEWGSCMQVDGAFRARRHGGPRSRHTSRSASRLAHASVRPCPLTNGGREPFFSSAVDLAIDQATARALPSLSICNH